MSKIKFPRKQIRSMKYIYIYVCIRIGDKSKRSIEYAIGVIIPVQTDPAQAEGTPETSSIRQICACVIFYCYVYLNIFEITLSCLKPDQGI